MSPARSGGTKAAVSYCGRMPLCLPAHFDRHTSTPMFICRACGWCSANANDLRHGYCGRCRKFTGKGADANLTGDDLYAALALVAGDARLTSSARALIGDVINSLVTAEEPPGVVENTCAVILREYGPAGLIEAMDQMAAYGLATRLQGGPAEVA